MFISLFCYVMASSLTAVQACSALSGKSELMLVQSGLSDTVDSVMPNCHEAVSVASLSGHCKALCAEIAHAVSPSIAAALPVYFFPTKVISPMRLLLGIPSSIEPHPPRTTA